MIRRRAAAVGADQQSYISGDSFISAMPARSSTRSQQAAQESPRTTKLYEANAG
jgi:hypothetical protein